MNRRVLVVVAGWVAAAVVATLVGVAAIRLVANDLTGPSARTVSEDDLQRRLASATPSPGASRSPGSQESPRPTATSSLGLESPGQATPPGQTRVLTSPGGSVLARCVDGQVSLDWWTPAQGYAVDHVERGPAAEVKVEFESDDEDVEMRIRCAGNVPEMRLD